MLSFSARNNQWHWITSIPAVLMTAVCVTYHFHAPEGFNLAASLAYPTGVIAAVVLLAFLPVTVFKKSAGRQASNKASAERAGIGSGL